MKKIFLLALAFSIYAGVYAQTKDSIDFNLDFEDCINDNTLPTGWFEWGSGCSLLPDHKIVHSGKTSVRIEKSKTASSKNFACVTHSLPAGYSGKRIELKAYLKHEHVQEGFVGLLLRIDGNNGTLEFENMQSEKIQGSSDWKQHKVSLKLPSKAETIYIGALLTGTGTLWVDDFELLIDGKDIRKCKKSEIELPLAELDNEFDSGSKIPSIVLNPEVQENLRVLGLIWGFLKYYHPRIASGDINWDYELFRIMPAVIAAKSTHVRDQELSNWILALGEFKVSKREKILKSEVKLLADLDWMENSNLSSGLKELLVKVKMAKRNNKHYYVALRKNVRNPNFRNENPYPDMSFSDDGYKLLSLYRYWNAIQYYFPYRYLIAKDWHDVLNNSIAEFVNVDSQMEYVIAVRKLIASINDTHATMVDKSNSMSEYLGKRFAALEVLFVEDQAVVTSYYNDSLGIETGIKKGDVITEINGKSINQLIDDYLPYISASNHSVIKRNMSLMLLETNDLTIDVKYKSDGKDYNKQLKSYETADLNIYKSWSWTDTCFRWIDEDICYVFPGTISAKHYKGIAEQMKSSKGLIIDLRCYPSDFMVFKFGRYLMPEPSEFVKFTNTSLSSAGTFQMTKSLKVGRYNKDYYKGKVIIIVNEYTQSNAEYTSMAFRVAPKVTVIGSQTAGADGNVSRINLPGEISTTFTGIGVYYPDGTETQGIGIVPDIEIKPTIRGIKEGRDELLEKAIELIQ